MDRLLLNTENRFVFKDGRPSDRLCDVLRKQVQTLRYKVSNTATVSVGVLNVALVGYNVDNCGFKP